MKFKLSIASVIFLLLIVFSGCNSYNVNRDLEPEQRLEIAKKMFNNKDYLEAKTQFKIITLNNPGASYVDQAQYYLAECHFHLKEYILAADEYGRLIRLYPSSERQDDALFKIAYCDYKLSPKPSLDQTYTVKAVENFQRFLEDFPQSELVPKAEELLKICRSKLAEKEYKAGELYVKLRDFNGAHIYFSSVIQNYYDTKFVEDAIYWNAESLYRLKKDREARQEFEELLRRYPDTEHKNDAIERLEEIDSILMKAEETSVSSSN